MGAFGSVCKQIYIGVSLGLQQAWYTWWTAKTFRHLTDFTVHSFAYSETDTHTNT